MVLNRYTNFTRILITLADNFACKPIAPVKLQSSPDGRHAISILRSINLSITVIDYDRLIRLIVTALYQEEEVFWGHVTNVVIVFVRYKN